MGERYRRWVSRAIVLVALPFAGYYGTWGGEYSVFDLNELRTTTSEVGARGDSLHAVVDSLESWSDRVTSDSAAIERVARERYGFLRDGERLYRFVTVSEEQEAESERGATGRGNAP